MKKYVLLLLSFVPVVAGWFVNILIMVPVLGGVSLYVLPLLTTVFWFFLGRQYAHRWKAVPAVLLAHTVGFASLLIYLWQFLLETDVTRNLTFAAFSQMFSSSAPSFLLGRLAVLFERQPNYAGRASMIALQVISLVYMVVVFSVGLYIEKRRIKTS